MKIFILSSSTSLRFDIHIFNPSVCQHFLQRESTTGLQKLLTNLGDRLPGTQILLHNEEGEFSRGKGLQVGALKMAKMHELLFFCDVDIVFNEQTLRRIRYETKQVRYSA